MLKKVSRETKNNEKKLVTKNIPLARLLPILGHSLAGGHVHYSFHYMVNSRSGPFYKYNHKSMIKDQNKKKRRAYIEEKQNENNRNFLYLAFLAMTPKQRAEIKKILKK